MLFIEIIVGLIFVGFLLAVGIELRTNRDKKMYVGREARTNLPVETRVDMPSEIQKQKKRPA